MRFPSRPARTPEASPAGVFTLRRVPSGIGTCSSCSTSRATKPAACSKPSLLQAVPARKSISPWSACWETAIAGSPSMIPSKAAATVPEYVMSSPRLAPWLIPDTISSGSRSIRPSAAKRTQSTGVPLVAKPLVPSSNSTSSTVSGSRKVMLRAVAERFESGAITASSMPGTSSSALRTTLRPVAVMPSSFVSRTFTGRGYSVADRLQVKALGRRSRPGLAARPSLEKSAKPLRADAVQHRSHQHAHHVPHERVGLDDEGQHVLALVDPLRPHHVALEAHVVGLGRREGGEVTPAEELGGARVERRAVERARPPERPVALERAADPAGQHAVAVGAALRVAAGVEPIRGRLARQHADVARQHTVQRARGSRVALVARHLTAGVHAAVGSPGHGQRHLALQHGAERLLEHALHGPQAGLARPPRELRAVVLEQQARGQGPTRACARRPRRTPPRAAASRPPPRCCGRPSRPSGRSAPRSARAGAPSGRPPSSGRRR